MSSTYKLISFSFCPYVQRPRIILLEKQIEHSVEYIDLQSPPVWFHEVSPLEKVPVLLVDDTALFESIPICEYLNEVTGNSFYSPDPLLRARQRAWVELVNEMLEQTYQLALAVEEPAYKRARSILLDRLELLEEELGAGPYFSGAEFGMVDVVYAPLFRFIDFIHQHTDIVLISPEQTPRLASWMQQLLARPSVEAAVPDSFGVDYGDFIRRQKGPLAQQFRK